VQSQHPVDRLIRELVDTGRAATDKEVMQIIDRMASMPFASHEVRIDVDERGTSYQGLVLGTRADSFTYHLIKRVAIERQWAEGTTAADYLEDLRRATRDTEAQLAVYSRRGGVVAAIVVPTARILPPERCGDRPEHSIVVIYSTDRGRIISGYRYSTLAVTGIPQEARWLR
jgi:hypothetical protein